VEEFDREVSRNYGITQTILSLASKVRPRATDGSQENYAFRDSARMGLIRSTTI
jgi:hypothetical protein